MPTLRPDKPDDQRLKSYDESFLACRNLGHVWRILGFFQGEGVIKRRLICQRCDADRTDRWEPGGFRRSPTYGYPEGYRLEGMQPAATQVRLEMMRRARIFVSEAEMLASMTGGS